MELEYIVGGATLQGADETGSSSADVFSEGFPDEVSTERLTVVSVLEVTFRTHFDEVCI